MTSRGPFPRILVATDFSPAAEEAWKTARRLAQSLGAELVLLHVLVEGPLYSESPFTGARVREVYASARAWAEKQLEQWAAEAKASGLAVRVDLRSGVPHREIVKAARNRTDLIVVGSRGLGGVERAMLGSVADRVIRLASCPVLSVRPASRA
jgi:nucleotide-binding universal stress UspA family protein